VLVVSRRYWRENLIALFKPAQKQGGRYVDEGHSRIVATNVQPE